MTLSSGLTGWLTAALLLAASHGFRIINFEDPDCSQKGIKCTIMNSNCIDISWLKPYNWTPSAPSAMEVREGLGYSEAGLLVPVLEIEWSLSKDSSILQLQGVEVSVLELSTSKQMCVQFHFENTFPSQVNSENKPWQFVFNNFEVDHREQYHVTVQNLPRLDNQNSKGQTVIISECSYKHTDACCQLGYCWNPNISIEIIGNYLVMSFDQLEKANEYNIKVRNHKLSRHNKYIKIPQVPNVSRLNYSINSTSLSPICFYHFEIWPVMPSCENDCVRLTFEPSCSPTIAPPSGPLKRLHLSLVSASITLVMFGCIFCVFRYMAGFLSRNKNLPHRLPRLLPHPPLVIGDPKVWLIYSADHKNYVNVVIKFSDFLRQEWGIEVILDLVDSSDIAKHGPMQWVCRQKKKMDDQNGSILVLCSHGAQEKWKAKQTLDSHDITVRKDTDRLLGDLFTAALNIIAPDFQKGSHKERYIVGYFEGLSNSDDIPSLFVNCHPYNLMRDLQDVYFRIHKIERYHPEYRYDVPLEVTAAYKELVKAVSICRNWPEKRQEEHENEMEVDCTVKNQPVLCNFESVSLMTPIMNDTSICLVMEPTIVDGLSSSHLKPILSEGKFSPQSVEPLLEFESRSTCIHEPSLAVQEADHCPYVNQDSALEPDPTSALEFMNDAFNVFQTINPEFCADNDILPWNEPLLAVSNKADQASDEGYLSGTLQ
uniref:SEFIR domain-containing protein n=1 Tax=Leptobrachium leishanense TaxID=445787 RepID=A0A8C5N444_9ANUR